MKWRNHKIVTFCTVFSVTGGLVAATAAMVGSVLPDILELGGMVKHRTVTHYMWFWAAGCLFFWYRLRGQNVSSLAVYVTFFVVSGGLLHVCQDALSIGGVPVYTPYGIKAGLGVYRTDTIGEEFTTLGLVLVFVVFSWMRGFFTSEYIGGQVGMIARLFLHF